MYKITIGRETIIFKIMGYIEYGFCNTVHSNQTHYNAITQRIAVHLLLSLKLC